MCKYNIILETNRMAADVRLQTEKNLMNILNKTYFFQYQKGEYSSIVN